MNYEIKKINNYYELKEIVLFFDNYFKPSITSRFNKIDEYIDKVHKYGEAYILKVNNDFGGLLLFYNNDDINKIGFLTSIAINKRYQGKGFGSILLDYFEKRCKETNKKYLKLEVNKNNKKALEIYKNIGYKITEVLKESCYMIKEI